MRKIFWNIATTIIRARSHARASAGAAPNSLTPGRSRLSYRNVHWLLLGMLALATIDAQAASPLRIGLLPYISPKQLVETYKPLKMFLERNLKRPVILLTARNYREFARAAEHFEYDVYHAPPHFALLAEQKFGYKRLSKFALALYGSVLARNDSPITDVSRLRHLKVAMPDETAMVTMLGEAWLNEHGLVPGQDVKIEYNVSHSSALLSVIQRAADVAVVTPGLLNMFPKAQREQVHEIARTSTNAHAMFMASPKLSESEIAAIKSVLLRFTAEGPGKLFFAANGCGDMSEIVDTDMIKNRPFVPVLVTRLRDNAFVKSSKDGQWVKGE